MTERGTVVLIVNPAAGRANLFARSLLPVRQLLASHGLDATVLTTTSQPQSARDLATGIRHAALVLACGGDGTVHDVVQGLAHTGVPLGIMPLGTANALARNLLLPLDPVAAVRKLLTYQPRSIPLGAVTTSSQERLFSVMAGCGPDGALVRTLRSRSKARFGRAAYYAQAARLFATRRWPVFGVSYRLPGSVAWTETEAVAMMCSRVPNLGGAFSGLTRGARLDDAHLQVHLLRAPAQVSLAAWFTLSRMAVRHPWMQTLDVEELRCVPLAASPVYAQVDGELLGELPISLRVVRDALQLLMP